MSDNDAKVSEGMVVSLDYTVRLDDGQVADSSTGDSPLQYLQGEGQIIPGLEREIDGMSVGEEKEIVVPPADAYGEHDPEAFETVPRSFFPEGMDLQQGMRISVQDQQGDAYQAYVAELDDENVVLDFNHPLAGQTLHFHVRVADVRPATDDEREHGHVHGAEGHVH